MKLEPMVMNELWGLTKLRATVDGKFNVAKLGREWMEILHKYGWSLDEWNKEVEKVNAILNELPEGFGKEP